MKTALLHYWMTNYRGGERVLAEFCGLFPDADIFTHTYNPDKLKEPFNSHTVRETFIGRLPFAKKHCQKYLPLMPSALKRMDLHDYDFILSSESGPVKGVKKPSGALHICYCHSPMRYIWDMYEEYYRSTGLAGKFAMSVFKNYMRNYDVKSADSVDHFIANSNFIKDRIKRIYNRDSTVIFPPVDTDFFDHPVPQKKEYYLFVSQLIPYKRPDLVLEACKKMDRELVIAGDGPMRKSLEKQATPKIKFVGRPSHEELRKLYAEAKAFIFPALEDFGIVPLEAQAAGTPVLALGAGGSLDTVIEGETGLYFDDANTESICNTIERFESMTFDTGKLKNNARRFSREKFRENMKSYLKTHGVETA